MGKMTIEVDAERIVSTGILSSTFVSSDECYETYIITINPEPEPSMILSWNFNKGGPENFSIKRRSVNGVLVYGSDAEITSSLQQDGVTSITEYEVVLNAFNGDIKLFGDIITEDPSDSIRKPKLLPIAVKVFFQAVGGAAVSLDSLHISRQGNGPCFPST
jgi:hypothetical protein